jgi:oligopeptide transport system ATP-binding protein
MSTESLIRVLNLRKDFQIRTGLFSRAILWAVDDISFDIPKGTTLGLVGESGCGKTTAGRCILRLIEPTSGQVWLDDEDISKREGDDLQRLRKRMQMVFQDPGASLTPRMTIGAHLREPLDLHTDLTSNEKDNRVRELLRLVGLQPDHLKRYPHQFSGGQLQRIDIARAIATYPDFVVLDEPTSALDVSIRGQILKLLIRLQRELGLTYLFISHDLSVIKYICRQVAVMYLGRIVEIGYTNEIFNDPRHPYTQALLSAVPVPDPRQRDRMRLKLPGEVPSPIDLPRGCPFYSRCQFRRDECLESALLLDWISPTHAAACVLVRSDHLGFRQGETGVKAAALATGLT